MVQYSPESFILYRPPGSTALWPAVVCTDDVAPDDFHRTQRRPSGYMTLVLRLGESLKLAWATTTDMLEFDPFYPLNEEEIVANTPGLGEAYAIANSALEEGFDLDYWRHQLRNAANPMALSNSDEDTSESDPDLQWAIRESRNSFYGTPTPSSPFKLTTQQTPNSGDSVQELDHRSEELDHIEPRHQSSIYSKFMPSKDLLSWDRLRKGSSAPTSDVVEGELAESKGFVLVYVGPEREERTLQKNHVWNRPYFQDQRTGIMYFDLNEDNIWVLSHPSLTEIEPEDFNLIAEWLESGQLGFRQPEGEEVQEAFAQIISAWETALKLGMTDLLDHIIDKLERLAPWDMWHIMALACHVFESSGPFLPAQERMKDLLATEIAQNFWIYIEDDHLSASFIQRLKDLPELERDIYARRVAALNFTNK